MYKMTYFIHVNKGDKMKEEDYFNQRIQCDVDDCKFKSSKENHCTLGKITVCGKKCKQETFCDSFEKSE